jgi:hypothetical protein
MHACRLLTMLRDPMVGEVVMMSREARRGWTLGAWELRKVGANKCE